MARRIVLAVLALVAAVLGVVAVPLGLITAHQDLHDFQDETVASATTLANVAEERLGDHSTGPALGRTVGQFTAAGDLVSVVSRTGRCWRAARARCPRQPRSSVWPWSRTGR